MKRTAAALALLAAISDVAPVRAEFPKFEIPRLGIFRKKKEDPPAPPPAKAQPAETPKAGSSTVDVLKADLDEKRRVAAAEALRNIDPRTNSDVMPALMASIQQDPSAAVRAAAAETVGKLKPVSTEAGASLEMVVVSDPSEAVRKAAQQALWQYHLNGYRSAAANMATPQTAEPPLAKPKSLAPRSAVPVVLTSQTPAITVVAPPPVARPITTGIGKGAIYPQTIEPPLAKPKTPVSVVKPVMPKVEVTPPVPSIEVPLLPTIPVPVVEEKMADPVVPLPTGVPVPPPSSIPTIPPPGS